MCTLLLEIIIIVIFVQNIKVGHSFSFLFFFLKPKEYVYVLYPGNYSLC